MGKNNLASGGVALPNGRKLLFGEAIPTDSAPGRNRSQEKFGEV
jgi:hypothetical protein